MMAIQSTPYYWLTCDAEDCDARYPDDRDEYSAWQTEATARVLATAAEWEVGGPDGDLCEDCRYDAEERRDAAEEAGA